MPVGPHGEMLPYPGDPGYDDASESVEDALRRLIGGVRAAAEADGTVSENERLLIEKLSTMAQQFLAGREKEQQAALGGGPATQFLRRTSGGA